MSWKVFSYFLAVYLSSIMAHSMTDTEKEIFDNFMDIREVTTDGTISRLDYNFDYLKSDSVEFDMEPTVTNSGTSTEISNSSTHQLVDKHSNVYHEGSEHHVSDYSETTNPLPNHINAVTDLERSEEPFETDSFEHNSRSTVSFSTNFKDAVTLNSSKLVEGQTVNSEVSGNLSSNYDRSALPEVVTGESRINISNSQNKLPDSSNTQRTDFLNEMTSFTSDYSETNDFSYDSSSLSSVNTETNTVSSSIYAMSSYPMLSSTPSINDNNVSSEKSTDSTNVQPVHSHETNRTSDVIKLKLNMSNSTEYSVSKTVVPVNEIDFVTQNERNKFVTHPSIETTILEITTSDTTDEYETNDMYLTTQTTSTSYEATITEKGYDSSTVGETTTEISTNCTSDVGDVTVFLTVFEITDESISILWETNSSCPNQWYIVSWMDTGTNIFNSSVTEESNYNISSLEACTQYYISVAAFVGDNETIGNDSLLVITKYSVTKPPEFWTIISVDKTFAVLQWKIPYDSFTICEPTSFTVDCAVVTDPPQRPGLINGTSTSLKFNNGYTDVNVTNLTPYTNYSCVAYATYQEDQISEYSKREYILTSEDVPPAPFVKVKEEGSQTLKVTWKINDNEVPGVLLNFTVTIDFDDSNATSICTKPESRVYSFLPSVRNCSLEDIKPFSRYIVQVSSETMIGKNMSDPVPHSTPPDVSDEVNVRYSFIENRKTVQLTWGLPCNTNGILESFIVQYSKFGDDNVSTIGIPFSECCNYEYDLIHLIPEHSYTVCVSAIVENVVESKCNEIIFYYPAGIPSTSGPIGYFLKVDPRATSVPTQTMVTFKHEIFQNNRGKIKWYEIIVAQNQSSIKPTSGLYNSSTGIPKLPAWDGDNVQKYRATPDKWMPFKTSENEQIATFLLGSEQCSEGTEKYCNGPLKPETTYFIKIRAFTSDIIGGYQDSDIMTFTTESEIDVGMIVGILLAIIMLGMLSILLVMYRKGSLVWPPKLFMGVRQATVRPQPILLKKFPAYCSQLLDTPTRLSNEYQLLATLSADIVAVNTCANGQQPENRKKNRYINILPYDTTRVTLDLVDGDPTSHYINASFIKGYTDDIEYIASQGPKEETCTDFWRMVYQHDVHVIAMVTNLIEQDKIKCYQYYPNLRENLVFGDMTIRCTTEINFPIHTARTLILIKGDRKRTISHLHFREWPDFGVPQCTDYMLQFCQTMRHHALAAELGLILVHCSAGVGRTGTLIAVDILLQHISENKKVDVFGTVFKLRKQRMNMVQTEGQYTYIYRCIKDAVEDPTIVNQGTTTKNSLEPIYENVGTSLNSLQYEKLPKWQTNNHTT